MGLPTTVGSYHTDRESFDPASLFAGVRSSSLHTNRGMGPDRLLYYVGYCNRRYRRAPMPANSPILEWKHCRQMHRQASILYHCYWHKCRDGCTRAGAAVARYLATANLDAPKTFNFGNRSVGWLVSDTLGRTWRRSELMSCAAPVRSVLQDGYPCSTHQPQTQHVRSSPRASTADANEHIR